MHPIEALNRQLVDCRRCPRLVEWREKVAAEKRKSFHEDVYWGRPVPYFGDFDADRLILGLAPAAHGANRTGRMFTGDRSGDWLFRALHRAGIASQPESTSVHDGLTLKGALIAASAHCAPPDNKPTPEELANCNAYFTELIKIREWKSILCLGGIAWGIAHRSLGERVPKFSHLATNRTQSGLLLVGSYHPSQQNTFTGRLTEPMLDEAIQTWLEVS